MNSRRIGIQCAVYALCLAFATVAAAAPPVTTIDDQLYKADGTPFDGVLMINWKSFEGPGAANVPTNGMTIQVVDGRLFVKLIPTTTSPTAAYYSVRYVADGAVQSTEIWSIPSSETSLLVRDVRVAWPPVTDAIVAPLTEITIADVEGLTNELSARPVKGLTYVPLRTAVIGPTGALEAVAGDPEECVRVDGTTGPCGAENLGGAGFVDTEIPAGLMDGVNRTFTLAGTPDPASSLRLYRNGLLLRSGIDYAASGNAVTFEVGEQPDQGEILQASYRIDPALTNAFGFVDAETPSGLVNGLNTVFTLSAAPNPASSLLLHRNGVLQKFGVDFNVDGSTVTFDLAAVPQSGDILLAAYRTGSN